MALAFLTHSASAGPGSGPKASGKATPGDKSKATYEMIPKQPGVVKLKRSGHTTPIILQKNGTLTPDGLDSFAEVLKDKSGAKHQVDARFAELFATLSDHFGGRTIDVVGGFRPGPGHSNHNNGKAIDFRIEGVPNDAVRDFCQTLDHAGVGFYPGGQFVHLDWRNHPRQWTDDTPLPTTAKAPKGSPHTPRAATQPVEKTGGIPHPAASVPPLPAK